MSKYFLDNYLWSENTKNNVGLPRPYAVTDPKFYKIINKFYLHKKIPIPWQSAPLMTDRPIQLIVENEDKVFNESLCPYCGVGFDKNEYVCRWTSSDSTPTSIGPRVYSDSHPFHINCMKQARVFCPFMRKTKDNEFEYGKYDILKSNAIKHLKNMELNNKMTSDTIKVIDSFVSKEECHQIIQYMDSQQDPSFWIINNTRQMIVNADSEVIKPILKRYIESIRTILNRDDLYITEYMLSRYNPGFMMTVHTDLEDGKEHFTVSAVAYLNDDFTGGDIVFPKQGFRHSPKSGQIVLFDSGLEENMHGVEPVKSGVRYAMPIWITSNPELELEFLKK
jgi:hypothetical protein